MSGPRSETELARLREAPWLTRPATQAVFRALAAGGFKARAVGGAVRNTLLGLPVKDVDIATTATPEDTMRLARASGLAAHPTGIAHGTVTIVSSHIPFEVTTLRRDAETFGRHARVDFTADWAEDAGRRDFTINALYCDADGTLFDPLGGLPDIAARRVRFIGNPIARIREDYLRILRFFRFSAEYAAGVMDEQGLAACHAERSGLGALSAERIHGEMLRLLAAPAATAAVAAMSEAGILPDVLGHVPDVRLFTRLAAIEAELAVPPDPLLRLGALGGGSVEAARHLSRRLKLSNEERDRLISAGWPHPGSEPAAGEQQARIMLYQLGADRYRDAVVMAWSRSDAPPYDAGHRRLLELPQRWTAPAMPVRGADLIARGVAPGPALGQILEAFEAWWIAADFPIEAGLIESKLAALIADSGQAPS